MSAAHCELCRYARKHPAFSNTPSLFLCHRLPPGLSGGEWPSVLAGDWCGEFRPADDAVIGAAEHSAKAGDVLRVVLGKVPDADRK